MRTFLISFFWLIAFNTLAQPLRPDGTMEYVESIVLNCQANLSSLYQERMDMVDEMERGKKQAVESLAKMGIKNPDINLEKIPPVLSETLDLEHAKAMEKNEAEFLEWESRFFMKNADSYIKECVTKSIEIHKTCSKNKKTAKDCLLKKSSILKEVAIKYVPFLRYLEEQTKSEKKIKKNSNKNRTKK